MSTRHRNGSNIFRLRDKNFSCIFEKTTRKMILTLGFMHLLPLKTNTERRYTDIENKLFISISVDNTSRL